MQQNVVLFLCCIALPSSTPFHTTTPRVSPSRRQISPFHTTTPRVSPSRRQISESNVDDICKGEGSEFEESWLLSNYKEVAERVFEGEDKRPVILFDGICNFCNTGVNFALAHDPPGKYRYSSLQSLVGRSFLLYFGRDSKDCSTIILVQNKDGGGIELVDKSDSIIEIARNLDGLSSALKGMAVASQIVPRPVRDLGYKMISQNRYRFMGKRYEGCRVGDTDEELTRFIEDPEVYLTE